MSEAWEVEIVGGPSDGMLVMVPSLGAFFRLAVRDNRKRKPLGDITGRNFRYANHLWSSIDEKNRKAKARFVGITDR